MFMDEKINLLLELVSTALDELYSKDEHLITYEAHECSIVFRFAHYLQNLMDAHEVFAQYNLDVEYNRNGRQPKRIPNNRIGVRPDVIIHKRGLNDHNLLIMEFKPPWERYNTFDDRQKLKAFTQSSGEYAFQLGLSIVLGKTRNTVSTKYVVDGEVLNNV